MAPLSKSYESKKKKNSREHYFIWNQIEHHVLFKEYMIIYNFKKLYIKHETVFHHIPNTEKRVENTTLSGVFLTNFEVFDIVMKHCGEYLIELLKQTDFEGKIKDAKTRSFSSDIQTRHGA